MNNARRKQLDRAKALIDEAFAKLEEAREIARDAMGEEEDSYDNLPEAMQDGERGEKMQECINNLNTAIDELDALDFSDISEAITAAQD